MQPASIHRPPTMLPNVSRRSKVVQRVWQLANATAVVQSVVGGCAQQGYHPVGFGNNGTVGIGQLKIPSLNGSVDVLSNYPWFVKSQVTKDMGAALAKYAPGVSSNPNFGPISVESWIPGVELQQAIEASKATGATVTAADVLKGLYTFHDNTLGFGTAAHLYQGKAIRQRLLLPDGPAKWGSSSHRTASSRSA